jgi:hypothetical protein
MAYKPMYHQVTARSESFGTVDGSTTGRIDQAAQAARAAQLRDYWIRSNAKTVVDGRELGIGGAIALWEELHGKR